MIPALAQFVLCAVVIIFAGTYLTRYADALADLTGLGRLLIGSILLAGATSLPELVVDVAAIRLGAADLAVGDLMGSSLFNLLILAALDLTRQSRGRMLSSHAAAHALSGSMASALTAIVGLGLLTAQPLAKYSLWGVSPAIFVLAAAYIGGVRLAYFDQQAAAAAEKEAGHPPHSIPLPEGITLRRAIGGFAVCALVIVVTGPFLAHAAEDLAALTGLGRTFVGTTLVALSTSLPELVSMIAALRIGAHDLAIGNVFGSNAFNMILLAPLDVIHSGSLLAAVSPHHAITCLAVVLATQVAVLGQLYRPLTRIRIIEPDAWLVIMIVMTTLALIYYLGESAAPVTG